MRRQFLLSMLAVITVAIFAVLGPACSSSSAAQNDSQDSGVTLDAGGDAPISATSPDSGAASPSDATLRSLSISVAPLTPAFAPTTLAYTVGPVLLGGVAASPAASTTVTATTNNPNAKIAINGVVELSGVASPAITLKAGMNAVDVAVVSADGTQLQHYAIAVAGLVNDYIKASNTRASASFGDAIALSADGSTLAVGSYDEDSDATGVNGNQADTSAAHAGAVYVFTRSGLVWSQQAYIKASNARGDSGFGDSVALSADGSTLAVGASAESSDATGVNGNQADTSSPIAGAAYVFTRSGTTWSQQAYIKASNTRVAIADFGFSLTLSADGNTLAVGAYNEASAATGVNGNQADTSARAAGAVYVFTRAGTTWSQQAYIKASNTLASATFGVALALSGDGNTLAVGASGESSDAKGVNGNQADTSAAQAGAIYIFTRSGTTWSQQAYVKASNTRISGSFGNAVALSSDGSTLAVASDGESSDATGVNGNQADTSASFSGAVYVFTRTGVTWSQQAYIKASNTRASAYFGTSVALSSDGTALAVGSYEESSDALGTNGNQSDTSAVQAGAVYTFTQSGGVWSQHAYVKASNTRANTNFGIAVAFSSDATTLAVGSYYEYSDATGINGNQGDSSDSNAGAVYVF